MSTIDEKLNEVLDIAGEVVKENKELITVEKIFTNLLKKEILQ